MNKLKTLLITILLFLLMVPFAYCGPSINDNDSGGSTAWSAIGDPTSATDIDFGSYQQIIKGDRDQATSSHLIRFYDDDSDGKTNDTYVVDISHKSNGDSKAHFLRGLDNDSDGTGGDTMFWVDYQGAYHGPGIELTGTSRPKSQFIDEDAAGADEADELAGGLYANLSTVTVNDEISDMAFTYMSDLASPSVENGWLFWKGSVHSLYVGVLGSFDPVTGDWTPADETGYESLLWDFDTPTDGVVGVSSPSGATIIDFSDFVVPQRSQTPQVGTPSGWTMSGVYMYGGIMIATGTSTANLPAIAAGMNFTAKAHGAVTPTLDPNGTEHIYLNGADCGAGVTIVGAGAAGDMAVLYYESSGVWSADASGFSCGS